MCARARACARGWQAAAWRCRPPYLLLLLLLLVRLLVLLVLGVLLALSLGLLLSGRRALALLGRRLERKLVLAQLIQGHVLVVA